MAGLAMRLSIRSQIVLLVSSVLLVAMGIYLALATQLFTSDKLEALSESNAQLAGTLAEEVRGSVHATVDKLLYFGAEMAELSREPSAGNPHRPATALFANDPDILGVEIWEKEGPSYRRLFQEGCTEHLEPLRVPPELLEQARGKVPMNADLVKQSGGVLLQNASLPPFLPLLRLSAISQDGNRVVVADMKPSRLVPAFNRAFQRAETYLVDGQGMVLVHQDDARVLAHESRSQWGAVRQALQAPGSEGQHEFEVPGGTRLGAWAKVRPGKMAVIVELPKAETTRSAWELVQKSVAFAMAVLVVALVLSVFFARRVSDPLLALQEKMESVSRGDFGVEVEVSSGNELGALAAAFNRMSRELGARERALLEAHQQLIQSEKLSALGEMSAGLAHEVKNPMVGICGFSELGAHVDTLEEAHEYFALINADAQRANEILQNLLAFARPEQVALSSLDVNETVHGAVQLFAHQVQLGGVKLVTSYADGLPFIMGSANQLRQVLINLAMNGAHAMSGSQEKVLTVSTQLAPEGRVQILVKDTGHGMSEETQRKLFRPFFTTKPKGQGTGLGLSVSKTIIQQHRGEISVKSMLGQGTTFTVVLPPTPPSARPKAGGVAPAA